MGLNNETWVMVLIVKFVSIASIVAVSKIERLKYYSVTFEPAFYFTFEKLKALLKSLTVKARRESHLSSSLSFSLDFLFQFFDAGL